MHALLEQSVSLRAHSLEGYLHAVRQLPVLEAEEEQRLAKRFVDRHDLAAARKMIISHLRLVPSIVRGYRGYGLPQEDLIQEGNIGLLKAIIHFDPYRNVRFAAFAIHWIRAEIIEFIVANVRLVKIATTKAQRKLFFNLRRLKPDTGWGKETDMAHIAATLEVPVQEVREMDKRLSGGDISLDMPEDSDRGLLELSASQADPGDQLLEKDMKGQQEAELKHALQALDARSRHIIEARWLAEGKKETLQHLADHYGLTAEGIRKIEQRGLKQLRQMMRPER